MTPQPMSSPNALAYSPNSSWYTASGAKTSPGPSTGSTSAAAVARLMVKG